MLRRRYMLGSEWLNNLMTSLLFITGFEYLHFITGLESSYVFHVSLCLLVLCSYLLRVYIHRLPVYLLLHVLLAAAVILIPYKIQSKVMLFVILISFTVADIVFWSSGEVRSFLPVHPALSLGFACVFAYASYRGADSLAKLAYVSGILFLGAYFLRTYLENGMKYALNAAEYDSGSVYEMLKVNLRLVIPLVICFIAGMFILQSEMLSGMLVRLLKFIGNCLGRLVTFLIMLLPKGTAEEAEAVAEGEFSMPQALGSVPEWVVTALLALEKVLSALFIVFIVYCVLKAVIRFFMMYFYRYGYDVKSVDYGDHTERREWMFVKKGRGAKKKGLFPTTYRDRVRRRYKREVEHLRRGGYPFLSSHTPAERLDDLLYNHPGKAGESFTELSREYEKVRYLDGR
ncbi:MAG: hypothetical protein K6E63_00120 [Lachnospiraceae bacterium]|nr:hypothetical protein [Lachnospiraceae bacterium]